MQVPQTEVDISLKNGRIVLEEITFNVKVFKAILQEVINTSDLECVEDGCGHEVVDGLSFFLKGDVDVACEDDDICERLRGLLENI